MMFNRRSAILATLLTIAAGAPPVASSREPIRLQFELFRKDISVARPSFSLAAESRGELQINGLGTVAFTPRLRSSDEVVITFEVESADGLFESVVELSGDTVTPVELPQRAFSESIRLTVGLVR
jgi:hypothetical protein